MVAKSRNREIAGDGEVQVCAGRVYAVRDRVGKAEDRGWSVRTSEQLQRQRTRAVERVRARDDAAVESKGGSGCRHRTLGLTVGRGPHRPRQDRDSAVAEVAEMPEALLHSPPVVKHDLASGTD